MASATAVAIAVMFGGAVGTATADTITVGSGTESLAITPDSHVYVADNDGTISVIDTPAEPAGLIVVGGQSRGVAVTPTAPTSTSPISATKRVSVIAIDRIPSVTGAPPAGVLGQPYTPAFTVSGQLVPVTVTATGALPDGLTLTDAGVLAGTPAKTGSFTFTVTTSNSIGDSDPLSVILEVTAEASSNSLGSLGPVFGS